MTNAIALAGMAFVDALVLKQTIRFNATDIPTKIGTFFTVQNF